MRQLAACLIGCLLAAGAAFGQGVATSEAPSLVRPGPAAGEGVCLELAAPAPDGCGRFHVEAELLLRWFKPVCASVPVVTGGDPRDPIPGAVGQPGTRIVIGGDPPHKFEFPMTPGLQLTLGWERGDGAIGFEASAFVIEEASNRQFFAADANGAPITYLPYQAPDNSQQALPFTIPGVVTGSSEAVGSTKLWGAEGDLVLPFTLEGSCGRCYGRFLVGARYLDLADQVRITNILRPVEDPADFALGMDRFRTHNQFGGAQVGTTLGIRGGCWALELTTKLAAGLTWQQRTIEGSPLLRASASLPELTPGPLLALPSNIGTESARRVTLVPEIGVKSRMALAPWCSVSLGYSLLYWNKVLCPGDQMSPLINVTQLPFRGPVVGPLDPKPKFAHTDYFAQGLNLGVEFAY